MSRVYSAAKVSLLGIKALNSFLLVLPMLQYQEDIPVCLSQLFTFPSCVIMQYNHSVPVSLLDTADDLIVKEYQAAQCTNIKARMHFDTYGPDQNSHYPSCPVKSCLKPEVHIHLGPTFPSSSACFR